MDDHLPPPAKELQVTRNGRVGSPFRNLSRMESKLEPVSEAQAETAAKPRGAPLRLSRRVGLLLSYAEVFGLSVWQQRWLHTLTRSLNSTGVEAAKEYAIYLRSHPATYQSLRNWLVYDSRPISGMREVHLRPKRRIGIGYRDKGSKPDPSKRARIEADNFAWIYEPDLPEAWWKDYGMIPLYALREGEWILFLWE